MKQPKKPTRENKVLMSRYNLIPANWMVVAENETELEIINKKSGRRRELSK